MSRRRVSPVDLMSRSTPSKIHKDGKLNRTGFTGDRLV
jgi:hypothetical protein